MANNYSFNPENSEIKTNERKLVIERLPEWMQDSEQIQKYFNDVVQQYFEPESQRLVDAYIGNNGSPAASGKIFVDEMNLDRQLHQLSPAYVTKNDMGEITNVKFYEDLVNILSSYGSLVDNQNRLFNGVIYSWTPPINPNKIMNSGSYFWMINNPLGITEPDYIVMERNANNGNMWSRSNFWYTVGDIDPNGNIVDEIMIQSSNFTQAKAPIIEYNKNIELDNYGTFNRGDVDLISTSLKPEDIVQRRLSDNIRIDGQIISNNDRILFTSIGNSGENNRIYKVRLDNMSNGERVYGLVLDEDEESESRPTGEPKTGDTLLIKKGEVYKNKIVYWNGRKWILAQEKVRNNQYPIFNLYDREGIKLNDPTKYPLSDFNGSNLFAFKINYEYPVDKVYGMQIELSKMNYHVYENLLQSRRFTFMKGTIRSEIRGLYYYKVITGNDIQLKTDWVRKENTEQNVIQVPEIIKTSMMKVFSSLIDLENYDKPLDGMYAWVAENNQHYQYYQPVGSFVSKWNLISNDGFHYDVIEHTFPLAQKVNLDKGDSIIVSIDGENNKDVIEYIKTGDEVTAIKISDKVLLDEQSIIEIKTYSKENIPDTSLGVYDVPVNLKNNPKNEYIDFVDLSVFSEHFNDIITKNITEGSSNDYNNYEKRLVEGLVDNSVGSYIIQNEASMYPLMLHMSTNDMNIFEAFMFTQQEYFTFKNKFNITMVNMYRNNPQIFLQLTVDEIVDEILRTINKGRISGFPFENSGVGSNNTTFVTYIPPSPQFLGILPAYEPQKAVYLQLGKQPGYYNIDHCGVLTKSYKSQTGVDLMDDVLLTLENRIFNSIDIDFKSEDFLPVLNTLGLKPTPYYTNTDYNKDEFDMLSSRGFINFIAINNINSSIHDYNKDNWATWNFSGTEYVINGIPTNLQARGSWRGIYTDMYGTIKPHTHPWEMQGFTRRPSWWNIEYKPRVVRVGNDPSDVVYVYEDTFINENGVETHNNLWDSKFGSGDVSTGTIRKGKRAGKHKNLIRFSKKPFNVVSTGKIASDGTPIMKIELISPIDLGMIHGELMHLSEPWQIGDYGDVEFTYMNTVMYPFDVAMTLLRAKPAQFANYFYDTKNSQLRNVINGEPQFLFSDTRIRLDINKNTIVHGENGHRTIGYQMLISENITNQNKNISKFYGDNLRRSDINVGYRLGGFVNKDELSFSTDSFKISTENQHIGLLNSTPIKTSILSSVKIVYNGDGYILTGYDLVNKNFYCLEPVKTGRRNSIKLGNSHIVHYNEYSDKVNVVKYGTVVKTPQELYTFLSSYGKFLEKEGWIFDESTNDGEYINWSYVAKGVVEWSMNNPRNGDTLDVSPSKHDIKFGTKFGLVQSVTEYTGGIWSILDNENKGISISDIDTTRIGNIITIRTNDIDKKISMLRISTSSYEHVVIFDNKTIFGDNIYIPKFGAIHEMIKMYGYISDRWNGRLEAPGFIVLPNDTIPNFEKTVEDFRSYYNTDVLATNKEIRQLSKHVIGYQSREYLQDMIINEASQMDFYRGYIKEKGTHKAFEKVLRVSKTYNTENYKALEEWAFKLGEYGNIDGINNYQFNINNTNLKQDPLLITFNPTDSNCGDYDFKGKNKLFPVTNHKKSYLPYIGEVTLNEVDFTSKNVETLYDSRIKYIGNTNEMPTSVWIFSDTNDCWNIYDIVKTDIVVEQIESYETEMTNTLKVVFNKPHDLKINDIFFIHDDNGYAPSVLEHETTYFFNPDPESKQYILINNKSAIEMKFNGNKPVLYKYVNRMNETEKEEYVKRKQSFSYPDTDLFNRPVIYHKETGLNATYVTLFDPINKVIDGDIMTNISFTSPIDPASYNYDGDKFEAWGKEMVGKIWWDTSTAYYVDYTIPVLDSNGNVDVEKTLDYRRNNVGRLHDGSEIKVYEWVRSPVVPSKWDKYCKDMANNKSDVWIPSGTALDEIYSSFIEYDEVSDVYNEVYYFWVRNTIYVPNITNRTKTAVDITRTLSDPTYLNTPYFTPISENAFIISGLRNIISDDKSVISVEYRYDHSDVKKHEQYQLCKEGESYNFNPLIWKRMISSLIGEETVGDKNINLLYPYATLGNESNKTWFMNVIEARRTFVDSANEIYKHINMTTNTVYMNDIFNVKDVEKNPNEIDIRVIRINNELVIAPNEDVFEENDPVLINTTGSTPNPLSKNEVYFIHKTPENYIKLMRTPSTSSTVTTILLTNQGEGVLSLIKQEDYNSMLSTSLDMTQYWEFTDWYVEGYDEFTPYTVEPSIDVANGKNYKDGDIIKIIGSDKSWTLYIKTTRRDIVIWEAIGRENSTIKLNEQLYRGYDVYDDGEYSARELNVRSALRLLAHSFENVQSNIIFDMVKYVHTEQNVVNWVFKTSFIYVLGLEQSLMRNYIVRDDIIGQIVDYFNEAKPYRTKIRSQIEQKTSDTDIINGLLNDLDPNGYVQVGDSEFTKSEDDIWDHEYAEFNRVTQKWEVKGSLPSGFKTPNRRFQESTIVLQFDNTQCLPTENLEDILTLETVNSKYMTSTENISHYESNTFEFSYPVTPDLNIDVLQSIYTLYPDMNIVGTLDETVNNYLNIHRNDIEFINKFIDDLNRVYTEVYSSSNDWNVLNNYVQYNTLTNRVKLYNKVDDSTAAQLVGCPFKGRILSDNISSRLPLGFSSSTDYNFGYKEYSKEFLEYYIKNVSASHPEFSEDELYAYILYEYGIYAWKYDYEKIIEITYIPGDDDDDDDDAVIEKEVIYEGNIVKDTIAVLAKTQEIYANIVSEDTLKIARFRVENTSSEVYSWVMMPRKYFQLKSLETGKLVDIPMFRGIDEYIEELYSIHGENYVLYPLYESMNDIPLDENTTLYHDYMYVIKTINDNIFVDDPLSFDNEGFESSTHNLSLTYNGNAINDPIFIDISTLNPKGNTLSNFRLTVSGYNSNNNVQIRNFSKFEVEAFGMLNPYNTKELIISIPQYSDAIELMKINGYKDTVQYIFRPVDIMTKTGKVKIPNHNFKVGDNVMVFVPDNSDYIVWKDNKWLPVLAVDNIKTGNKPTIFKVKAITKDSIHIDGLIFENKINSTDGLCISILKVTSFNDDSFKNNGMALYTNNREYKVDILNYDKFYDRYLSSNKFTTNKSLDSWYVSNETYINDNGDYVDHGYFMPIVGKGVLSELVRTDLTNNVQIYVYEYNVNDIKPSLVNGKWTYKGDYNGVYINGVQVKSKILFASDEFKGTYIIQPKGISYVNFDLNIIINIADETMLILNDEMIEVINNKPIIRGLYGSVEHYYMKGMSYHGKLINIGRMADIKKNNSGNEYLKDIMKDAYLTSSDNIK